MIDIRDYGAAMDGQTDDTAAWQTALVGAAPIYVPPGVSVVSGLAVTDRPNVAIVGAPGAALWLADGSDDHLLHATRCHELQIHGLSFDGNKAGQTPGLWCGLRIDECDDGVLSDVRILDATNAGAAFRGCVGWSITGVHTARCGRNVPTPTAMGIAIGPSLTRPIPSGRFQIAHCSDVGSGFDDGTDQQGGGLFLGDESYGCHVADYSSRDSHKYGVKVQGTRHILSSVTVDGALGYGLALQGNELTVNGYHARDCRGGLRIAHFTANPDTKAIQISDVLIEDVGFDGGIDITNTVELGPMMGVQIANVRIRGSERFGIRIRGAVKDVQIVNAHVRDCTNQGIVVNSYSTGDPSAIILSSVIARDNDVGLQLGGSGVLVGSIAEDNGTDISDGTNWQQ